MTHNLTPVAPILLIDDEPSWLHSLTVTLKSSAGLNHILPCSDPREVLSLLARQPVSLILLDLVMPHLSGEELLRVITRDYPEIPVIILSGMNQLETAVTCMRQGAFDFFVKTTEIDRLIAGVQRALAFTALQQENRQLKEQVLSGKLEHGEAFAGIITASRKMTAIFHYIEAVAGSAEPILVTGESGVGKDLVVRAVHRLSRPGQPIIAVNVGGLDDNVFSDTLFGHSRGAFTGAEQARKGMIEGASGGTLFLDEIGDLTPTSQVKLLRLLQDGEYYALGSDTPKRSRARIICATNQPLEEQIKAGTFRKDLYFRLCCHRVHIPPLRERPDDLPLLLRHFSNEAAQMLGKACPELSLPLPRWLMAHPFPGNIRELRALVFDAVTLHRQGKLSFTSGNTLAGDSILADEEERSPDLSPFLPVTPASFPTMEEAGHLLVAEALRLSGGNRTIAARMLGITRQGLSKRLKK